MKNITKLHQLKHILLGLSLILSFSASAQFTCDASALYQTIQIGLPISGVGNTGDFILYRVDPATANFIFIANLSRDDDGPGANDTAIFGNINALAYNPVDNYIYGIDQNDDHLYRIDSNGNVNYLGQIEGAITNYNLNISGTFDANGIYYISGNHGYLITVDLSSTPVAPIQSTLVHDIGFNSADIALNPADGFIYGWNPGSRQLFKTHPSTGQTEIIGPAEGTDRMKSFGALYFTSGGQLIGYGDDSNSNQNNQETLAQINTTTGRTTIIGTGELVQVNDGASCPFGIELLKDGPDTTRLNETFTYTFTVFNASGNVLNGLEFTDNLPSNLNFNSNPYDLTNGLSSTGTTNGATNAVLTLNNVPVGESSFKIDVVASCSFTDNEISNQATLVSSFATVISDDPDISGINNPTITTINNTPPTFSVPNTINFEGCSVTDINSDNAIFPYSSIISSDVKDIFNTETGYTASSTDNILSITYIDNIITSSACAIEVNRVFTLTDTCNNTENKSQTITVLNTPVFSEEPEDVSVECHAVPDAPTVTASDSCNSNEITVSFNEERTDGACDSDYILTRTWTTAVGTCGNTAEHIQTIIVSDNTAPTFTAPSAIEIVTDSSCDYDASITITGDVTDEADNCSSTLDATYTDTVVAGACEGTLVITRTWSLVDDCGNAAANQTQTITVSDNTPPIFSEEPADVSVECHTVPDAPTVTASDSCNSNEITVSFNEERTDGACDSDYILKRTWTAVDACGNTAEHIQTITVSDNTTPTFTAPSTIEIVADASCNYDAGVTITGNVTDEADNCSSTLDATYTDTVVAGACEGTLVITRTWSLVDDCGNAAANQTQTITVSDNTAPVFSEEPADVSVECSEVPNAPTVTATDSCNSNEISVSFNEERTDGTCDSDYILKRTWTAVDACGNTAEHIQTITVSDNTTPTFTAPSTIEIVADASCNYDAGVTITGDVTDEADNCSSTLDATYTDTVVAGACEGTLVITRTWSLVDDCGNAAANQTQTITVSDNTAPVFSEEPADVSVECHTVPDAPTVTATDSCNSNEITVSFNEERTEGACDSDYILKRTWTAVDACGNTAEHIQTITVSDTVAPIMTTAGFETEITVNCGNVPDAPQLEFEDACSSDINVNYNETSTDDGSGSNYEIARTWTVTDDCENERAYTQTVSVILGGIITGTSTELCMGDNFDFDLFDLLSGDYGTEGTWAVTTGDTNISENIFNPLDVALGDYTFTYTDDVSECPSETEVFITINDDCVILPCSDTFDADNDIPMAVTPNGDNRNDTFVITGLENAECIDVTIELQIFNRWGAKIYESINYQNNWDGTTNNSAIGNAGKVPTGTYYYIINLKDNSGSQVVSYAGPIYVGTK